MVTTSHNNKTVSSTAKFNTNKEANHGKDQDQERQEEGGRKEASRSRGRRELSPNVRFPEASDKVGFNLVGLKYSDADWRKMLAKASSTNKTILDYRGEPALIPAFGSSHELRQWASKKDNGIALLSFSRGKDAIAAFLAMRPYFREIHLLHYEIVPDLSFTTESIEYFERKWGVKVHRFPHPEYWRMVRNLLYQPPKRADTILSIADTLPRYDYERLQSYVKADLHLPMQTLCGTGVRWADNMQRRLAIKSNGVVSSKRYSAHMVWDWSLEDVRNAIRKDGVKLPPDYTLFGNSWDGIDYRYMSKIRAYYPRDFQLILEHFPLLEAELFRYEKRYGYPRKGNHSYYLKDIVKDQK